MRRPSLPRDRSLATQWALRYGFATFAIVSAVLLFQYTMTRDVIQRDAGLLLRLQASELVRLIENNPGGIEPLQRYLDAHGAMGYRVLSLGFRVINRQGEVVVERGSTETYDLPLPDLAAADRMERQVSEVDVGEDYPFFVMTVPARKGWVQVAISTQLFARGVREIRNLSLLSIPIVLLVTTGFGVALARSSLRPIADVIERAEEISATRLGRHVPTRGTGDEIDRLAQTFNAMTDRIAAGVARMRRFSAEAAHELRTPVSLMRNRLETALDTPRDAEADQALVEQTLGDIDRLAGTISAMLRLAHSEAGLEAERVREVELRDLIAGIVEFFEPLATEAEVLLGLERGREVVVSGDPTWLHQLFANLIDNAIKFTPAGGRVAIAVRELDGGASIDVADTGTGIPDHELEAIFESFHRVESPLKRAGSGLGLPLAREIARAHGGDILVESELDKGSCFRVWLPGPRAAGRPSSG